MALPKKNIASINSSALYPLWFPGTLTSIVVNGTSDRHTYNNETIVYGLDYAVMKYDYPRFSYVNDATQLPSACYVIQFVDNLDGMSAVLNFNDDKNEVMEEPSDERPYVMVGNTSSVTRKLEGYYLRYNDDSNMFVLNKDGLIGGYEAFIITSNSFPAEKIVISNDASSIKRVFAKDGTRLSVKPNANGAMVYADKQTSLSVYSISGTEAARVSLQSGENSISLPKGIYVANGIKFIVK
jgi:hypothetical protein